MPLFTTGAITFVLRFLEKHRENDPAAHAPFCYTQDLREQPQDPRLTSKAWGIMPRSSEPVNTQLVWSSPDDFSSALLTPCALGVKESVTWEQTEWVLSADRWIRPHFLQTSSKLWAQVSGLCLRSEFKDYFSNVAKYKVNTALYLQLLINHNEDTQKAIQYKM